MSFLFCFGLFGWGGLWLGGGLGFFAMLMFIFCFILVFIHLFICLFICLLVWRGVVVALKLNNIEK